MMEEKRRTEDRTQPVSTTICQHQLPSVEIVTLLLLAYSSRFRARRILPVMQPF